MNEISQKPITYLFIAGLFAYSLYILVTNVSKYQGWGGDYAGYVDQARSIVEGRSTTNSNYIYNSDVPSLAPPSYPMVFQLLSPIYKIFGTNPLPYVRTMSFLWWLCGVSLFFFLKRSFPLLPSAITALLFLFNPYYFSEKNGILPDSFFTICLLWGIYFFVYKEKKDLKSAVLCGFFTGLSIITRANGIVLLLAISISVILEQIITWIKIKKIEFDKDTLKQYLGILISTSLVVLIVKIWLPAPEGGSYFDQILMDNIQNRILDNFELYKTTIKNYLRLPKKMPFMYKVVYDNSHSYFAGTLAMVLAFIGFCTNMKKQESRFLMIFLFIFTSILSVWPMVQGFRYVLPVLPIYLYFTLLGIERLKISFLKNIVYLLFPILLVPIYKKINWGTCLFYIKGDDGAPEYTNNQEAYQYVNKNFPKETIFAYHHPLILGMYIILPKNWTIN
jgi:4-amino-4-deoxy-L-arabinose transferase-like glycosyltransferase